MSECFDLHKLNEPGLEEKEQQPLKQRKGFKLLWLPVLARNEVIRSMDIEEIIKMSMSSKKMEGVIRYTKVKVDKINFHVNIHNSTLQIESFNGNLYLCSPDKQKEGSNNIDPQILSRWIDKNSSSFQNCVSLFKHLRNIISFKSLCLHVNFEGMTMKFFKGILTERALKDFQFLCLDKGEIDSECLDLVMGMAHSNRDLHILRTKLPNDYYHDNAFKFHRIFYYNAEWVHIEHLCSLKDNYSLDLGWNKLTYADVNTFMKCWIESDHDKVKNLKIFTTETFQFEELFDGIVFLEGWRKGRSFRLIAANPEKQRKHQVMGVIRSRNLIHLYSWDKDEPIRFEGNEYDDSWKTEYKVLRILNKKKDLEGELKKVQDLLKINQDQNMIEKRNDISKELRNVSIEFASYNLVLRDGVYSYM